MKHEESVSMVIKMINDGKSDREILNKFSRLPEFDRRSAKMHIRALRN